MVRASALQRKTARGPASLKAESLRAGPCLRRVAQSQTMNVFCFRGPELRMSKRRSAPSEYLSVRQWGEGGAGALVPRVKAMGVAGRERRDEEKRAMARRRWWL